jgi:hypothetical protein
MSSSSGMPPWGTREFLAICTISAVFLSSELYLANSGRVSADTRRIGACIGEDRVIGE